MTVTLPSFLICTLFNKKLTCRLKLVSVCLRWGVCDWKMDDCGNGGGGGIGGGMGAGNGNNGGSGVVIIWRDTADGMADGVIAKAAGNNGDPALKRCKLLPLSLAMYRCISLSSNATSFSNVAIRASFVSIIALYVLLDGDGVCMAFSNCIWSDLNVSLAALSS